jgi:hypothetical protein
LPFWSERLEDNSYKLEGTLIDLNSERYLR